MSRSGSMTTPTPWASSNATKLALPSSGAGTASTVYMGSLAAERRCRQQDPDGDERHHHRAAVKDGLRRHAPRRMHAEVDQQVPQPVREVKERKHDQHQDVELHQRIAEEADPRVVVLVGHGHDAERPEDALDHDVDGEEQRGDDAALRKQEPEDQVIESRSLAGRRFVAHRANQMRTNATTAEAPAHAPNIARTISREGIGRSRTLIRMMTPASFRNV